MKTLLTLALLSVFLALPVAAGTLPIPIDAEDSAVNFVLNGAAATDTTSLEFQILSTTGDSVKGGKRYLVAYIACDADAAEDLVYSPWGITVSGTDTTYALPGFATARGDSTGSLSPGQSARLYLDRKVDTFYFSAGKGKVVLE